ncbi:hypothetical protein [Ferruginibacter sp.]|nr:hypothetical protein [Ferruginibacter sp.]
MFESILIRPNQSKKHPIDFGQLIENLFFYKKTIAHLGRNEIKGLFDLADVEVLEQLLELPSLSIYFNNSFTAIGNENDIRFVDSIGLANLDIEKELYEESFRHRNDKSKSKKFSKKLSRLIKEYELPKNFNKTLNEQLKDEGFRNKVLKETIVEYQPELSGRINDLKYEIEFIDEYNFKINSNFDTIGFDEKKVTIDSPILALINACEDIQVMSEFNSEISLPEFNSSIVRLKVDSILNKSKKSQREIEVFTHFAFNESWALREAINKKQIHVKAALQILKKGEKYKEWLQGVPENSNLMLEYVEKVEERTVLEYLPLKAIRFYLFNGIGAILSEIKPEVGIPLTVAANAFNDFVLDNIGRKWKPNQFIEGELRPLVQNRRLLD